MVTPSPHVEFQWQLRASLIAQFIIGGLGVITNGAILICLLLRPQIRTQPNFLVCNLSLANLLVCIVYVSWASLNITYEMEPSIALCMCIMAPAMFSLNVSLCYSVAITHHRSTCCLMGYSSIHGLAAISEKWKLIAASISVWSLTFLAAAAAFIDLGADGALPVCIYPVALQNSYLVPFAIFTGCLAGVVVVQHVRVISLLTFAWVKNLSSEKPNPVLIRSTAFLLAWFLLCWGPLIYISCLFFHPSASVYQEYYYHKAQWLCTLPVLHASLIDPFVYALSEREYLETISAAVFGPCPVSLRWTIKFRLQRFDPFYRNKRREAVLDGAMQGKEASDAEQKKQTNNELPFSVSAGVIEMSDIVVNYSNDDRDRSGHINLGYRSEYI